MENHSFSRYHYNFDHVTSLKRIRNKSRRGVINNNTSDVFDDIFHNSQSTFSQWVKKEVQIVSCSFLYLPHICSVLNKHLCQYHVVLGALFILLLKAVTPVTPGEQLYFDACLIPKSSIVFVTLMWTRYEILWLLLWSRVQKFSLLVQVLRISIVVIVSTIEKTTSYLLISFINATDSWHPDRCLSGKYCL